MYKPQSQWAKYIWEREGKYMVESAQGFATYALLETHCYLEDIYVVPELRGLGGAQALIAEVVKNATDRGYTKLLGSCVPGKQGSDQSLSMALHQGFKVISALNGIIYYEKEL